MNGEWKFIWKEQSRGLIEVCSRNSLEETKENHEEFQLRLSVFQPRFELRIFPVEDYRVIVRQPAT